MNPQMAYEIARDALQVYECPMCDFTCEDIDELAFHLRKKHTEEEAKKNVDVGGGKG